MSQHAGERKKKKKKKKKKVHAATHRALCFFTIGRWNLYSFFSCVSSPLADGICFHSRLLAPKQVCPILARWCKAAYTSNRQRCPHPRSRAPLAWKRAANTSCSPRAHTRTLQPAQTGHAPISMLPQNHACMAHQAMCAQHRLQETARRVFRPQPAAQGVAPVSQNGSRLDVDVHEASCSCQPLACRNQRLRNAPPAHVHTFQSWCSHPPPP